MTDDSQNIPEPDRGAIYDLIGTNKLLEMSELAALLGIHVTTLRRLVARGGLTYVQVSSRKKLIPTSQLTSAIADGLRSLADGVHDLRSGQQVYFIGAGKAGPVKIGMAYDLRKRLNELQIAHYEVLAMLASCPGGLPLEQEYHRRFAAHRLMGEWFTRTPGIEAEIARLQEAVA